MDDIRPAKFQDIPAIIALGHQALSESQYAGAAINETRARNLLLALIGAQGEPKTDAAMVLLAFDGDELDGLIIGAIRPAYEVLSINQLSQVMWYVKPGTGGRVAIRLLRDLHKWADSLGPMPKIHVAGNTITDPELTGRLFRMEGFEPSGTIYYRGE